MSAGWNWAFCGLSNGDFTEEQMEEMLEGRMYVLGKEFRDDAERGLSDYLYEAARAKEEQNAESDRSD